MQVSTLLGASSLSTSRKLTFSQPCALHFRGMPICIECRYPVPQLYHVLHSTSKPPVTPAPTPSSTSHQKSTSNGSQILAAATASIAKTNEGTRGGGEAKKSSSSSDVRLTQCPRCKRFADKYVEHDFVVLFIDLVLVKPQVYQTLSHHSPPSLSVTTVLILQPQRSTATSSLIASAATTTLSTPQSRAWASSSSSSTSTSPGPASKLCLPLRQLPRRSPTSP